MNFFYKYKFYIIVLGVIVLLVVVFGLKTIYLKNSVDDSLINEEVELVEDKNQDEENEEPEKICTIDIKGAIKNAGVYKLSCDSNVNDVINLAGGIQKGGVTTNINLSKKIVDEMVIVISTKSELEKKNEIKECVCSELDISSCDDSGIIISSKDQTENTKEKKSVEDNNQLININNATKDDLLKLNGIGESKAIAIIDYRNTNGAFAKIEDIKNVTGIGEALFEKIKDFITV